MTKPLTTIEREQLEMLVDAHSMADVLDALEIIANEKAVHISENWQDRPLAKLWANAARQIDGLGHWLRSVSL